MKILKLNSFGWDVIRLNLSLDQWPSPYFDHDTEKAVKKFQKDKGLKVDGEVGPMTRKALGLETATQKNGPINPHKGWLLRALALEGTQENPRPGEENPLIRKFHESTTVSDKTDETPWCSSFLNYVITESGHEGTNDALAMSWLGWRGGVAVTHPEPGDIVIVRLVKNEEVEKKNRAGGKEPPKEILQAGYHVGFYMGPSPSGKGIVILGGNQGPDGSGSVNQTPYRIDANNDKSWIVKGYRRPKNGGWSIFIKLGDILGSATQKGYEGYSYLASLSGGIEYPAPMETGMNNRRSGMPSFSPFAITKLFDKASPALHQAVLRGTPLNATIVFLHNGREQRKYQLRHVQIAGRAQDFHEDGILAEAFMLSWGEIEMTCTDYDASGKACAPVRVAYDIGKARLV